MQPTCERNSASGSATLLCMHKFTTEAAQSIRRAIETGELHRAIELHCRIFPPARVTHIHDTDENDLREFLHTPLPIFSFCTDEELRELRLRLATAICLGARPESALMPDAGFSWDHPMSLKAAAQNFFNAIGAHRNISGWLKSGLVETARILNSSDGPCSACLQAAHEYELHQLPNLPLHNCENLNTIGCRCVICPSRIKGLTQQWK